MPDQTSAGSQDLLTDENLREIFDNMVEGCQVVDFGYRYIYVNETLVEHSRKTKAELLGRTMTEVYPGIEHTDIFQLIQRCAQTREKAKLENEFVYPDGTSGWFDLSIQPVKVGVMILSVEITKRKLAEVDMRRRLKHLNSLRRIDLAIAGSLDLALTLSVALDQVLVELGVGATAVLLFDQTSLTLRYAQGVGFNGTGMAKTVLGLQEGLPRVAVVTKKRHTVPDFDKIVSTIPRAKVLADEGFRVYHACPLVAKGMVIGVLEVFERQRVIHDDEWFDFLDTLAGQISIGIESLKMFEGIQHSNLELVQSHDATIEGWSRALDLRDKETEGHTKRVTRVAHDLASRMGYSNNQMIAIRRGALLHDIGKMGVPDQILLKPGKLTEEEWVIMKRHPLYAYDLLSPIPFLADALDIPHFHHERWDGQGYPNGLAGTGIPASARLFAVVDVWDALRSERPYREALGWDEVRRIILEEEAGHFDPDAVRVFMEMMKSGDQAYRD